MWMVRSAGGSIFDDFKAKSIVALGWAEAGNLSEIVSRAEIESRLEQCFPERKPGSVATSAGQLFRFYRQIEVGNEVATYDPSRRQYLLGEIISAALFDPSIDKEFPNIRKVRWKGEVPRDALSPASRNSLAATLTLFRIPDDVALELREALETGRTHEIPISEASIDEATIYADIAERSAEFVKDEIARLDWRQLQELVAGLLRALGYKTRISPDGADRGKDIVASPDGFGFEQPRIIVEVKHRAAAMGSPEIRSFLGGRHVEDKGLYVSTGGFTKEARYEAERANIPLTLLDADELVSAIVENYEALDPATKQILPLKRIYLPA